MTSTLTAIHEAGHAVAHITIGARRVVVASIVPDPKAGTLGHVRTARWAKSFNPELMDSWAARRRLEPEIVSLYAGVVAERKANGRRHNWRGAESDMQIAVDLLLYCVGSSRQANALSAFLWAQAQDLVDGAWPKIEAVASVLVSAKTLSRSELDNIIWTTP